MGENNNNLVLYNDNGIVAYNGQLTDFEPGSGINEADSIVWNKTEDGELVITTMFDTIKTFKLLGLFDLVVENCQNKRVAHLIKYGNTYRVRHKNFKRAIRMIGN